MVIGTLPADAATAVAIDQPLVVLAQVFSEPLSDSDVAETTVALVGPSGTPIAGELRLAPFGDLFVFEPAAPLDSNTTYQWTVTHPSAWGDPEPEVQTVAFTTGAETFDVGARAAVGDLELSPEVAPVFGGCDPDVGFDSCGGCELLRVGEVSVIRVSAPITSGSPASQVFGVRLGLGASPEEAVVVAERSRLRPVTASGDDAVRLDVGRVESPAWGADQVCVAAVGIDVLERTWLEGVRCAPLPAWLPLDGDDPETETPEVEVREPETETPEVPGSETESESSAAPGGCSTSARSTSPLLGLLLPFGLVRRRALRARQAPRAPGR
jgi:hypothetical protein